MINQRIIGIYYKSFFNLQHIQQEILKIGDSKIGTSPLSDHDTKRYTTNEMPQ